MPFLIGCIVGIAVFVLLNYLLVERRAVVPLPAGVEAVERPAPYSPSRRRIEERLDTIGMKMSPTSFRVLQVAIGVGAMILALIARAPFVLSLIAFAVGMYLPVWWVGWEEERLNRLLASELPGASEDIAGALRVHRAVRPALQEVRDSLRAVNPSSVLARELDRVLVDTELAGGAVEVGLLNLQKRASNPDLQQLAGTLLVFHRAGPDMLEVLAEKARTARANLELQAEIRSSLSEHRFLLRITPLLSLGAYIFLNRDPLAREFQGSAVGMILLVFVAGMMAVGYLMVQSLIQDAEP